MRFGSRDQRTIADQSGFWASEILLLPRYGGINGVTIGIQLNSCELYSGLREHKFTRVQADSAPSALLQKFSHSHSMLFKFPVRGQYFIHNVERVPQILQSFVNSPVVVL